MQLIIHRFKTTFSNCKTILSISMHGKKNKLQKPTPSNIREKNLMSRQHQHNCFNKTERRIVLKSFLPLTARKNCFYSSVWETKTFTGIVIFWVGGKNCIVKSEKCIVFPESWYVNSNPAIRANFVNRKNHPSVGQWWITYIYIIKHSFPIMVAHTR